VSGLHAACEPYASGQLEVGDGQSVYWETVGDPAGTPVVYRHGGPGSGSTPFARRYFEPGVFRAVLFDQRGCGRSRPLADEPGVDLLVNTTDHLVADIERLREELGVDSWIVLGISWETTLALVYAQRHPERVSAMVLGAVTAGTGREIEWITRQMGRVFPREWERYIAPVPDVRDDGSISAAYAQLLASSDPRVREDAARRWCAWEDTHVSLVPGWVPDPRYEDPLFRLGVGLLE
jgi:proline iminopeptidase